jgi:hypothetical protein
MPSRSTLHVERLSPRHPVRRLRAEWATTPALTGGVGILVLWGGGRPGVGHGSLTF